MNKIKSTRILDLNSIDNKLISLPFLNSEFDYKKSTVKLIINNDKDSETLTSWNNALLNFSKHSYDLVKNNHPYQDCCFVKLKMQYSLTEKKFLDKLKTEIIVKKKKEEEVSLNKLNKLINEFKKIKITLEATSTYNWKETKGINYFINKIEFN